MSESLPIIFIFRGNTFFFQHAIKAALRNNPANPVILLGTDENSHYQKLGVEFHDMSYFFQNAVKFADTYVHRSKLSLSFELFCFQRWFVVRDFMQSHSIKRALHLDGDVMLFSDVATEGERFRSHDLTLSAWESMAEDNYQCGHNCYINNFETLNLFCDFMIEQYSTPQAIARLDHFFDLKRNMEISDMLMLGQFAKRYPEKIGNINRIENGCYFDDFFSRSSGFRTETRLIKKNMKKIRMKDGTPWGWYGDQSIPIRFLSIHFHGSLKYLMKYFDPENPKSFFPGIIWDRLYHLSTKHIPRFIPPR